MDIRFIASAGYDFYCEPCVSGTITTCTLTIWDGTGTLDVGVDWNRSGYGTETVGAAHAGTNGLDVSSATVGDDVEFTSNDLVKLSDYDLLKMWVNVNSWDDSAPINVGFYNGEVLVGNTVDLSTYLNPSFYTDWQHVFIKLEDFGIYDPVIAPYADKLSLLPGGDVSFYLDDVVLSLGTITVEEVDICDGPSMVGIEVGGTKVSAKPIVPCVTVTSVPTCCCEGECGCCDEEEQ